MENELKQSDEIWTKDDQKLGHARRLCHRTKDISPALKLYADYVYVVSFETGIDYYIPLDFLDGLNPDNDHITLTVPMKKVQKDSWSRLPDFVVHREVEWEDLPGKPS